MEMYKTMGLGLAILLFLSVTGCGVKQVAMSGQERATPWSMRRGRK